MEANGKAVQFVGAALSFTRRFVQVADHKGLSKEQFDLI